MSNELERSRRAFIHGLPISEAAKKALATPDNFTTDHAVALAAFTTYGHIMRHNTQVKPDFSSIVAPAVIMSVFDTMTADGIIEWLSEIGGRALGGPKAKRQLSVEGGAGYALIKVEAVAVLMGYVCAKRPAVVRDIAQALPSFRPWRELLVDIDAAETYDPATLNELSDLMRRTRVGATLPDTKRLVDAIGRETVLAFDGSVASASATVMGDRVRDDDHGAAVADYVSKLLNTGMSGEDATKHVTGFIKAVHDKDIGWLSVAMNASSGLPSAPVRSGYARALFTSLTGIELSAHEDASSVLRRWSSDSRVNVSPDTAPATTPPPSSPEPVDPKSTVPSPTHDEKFNAKYGVNDEQAAIVRDRSPFVVVPAAAGSGKTKTVTTKIKFLVEEAGVNPRDIRIVAFNKHAAIEISSRLSTLIGRDNTKSVEPMTTHKFASTFGFLSATDLDGTAYPSGKPRIKSGRETVFLPAQPDLIKAAYAEAVERSNIKPGEMDLNMRVLARFIDNYKNFGMTLTEYLRQWYPQREDPQVRFLVLGTLLYEEQKGYTLRERARYGAEYDRLASAFMAEPKNAETEAAWNIKVRTSLGDGALTIRHDLTDWVSEMYEAVTPKEYDDARSRAGKEARLRRLQEQHKVLIVDESQDLAPVQVMLYRAIGMGRDVPGSQYIRVGDDGQCVDSHAMVTVKENGVKVQRAVRDVKTGDRVLAWSSGRMRYHRVSRCWKTEHAFGFRVHTDGGKSLLMSPNHRIYASVPVACESRWYVYLMYHSQFGFRVGITKQQSSDAPMRGVSEQAHRLWYVACFDSKERALEEETRLSLRHGIPQCIYPHDGRDRASACAASVFAGFGQNGHTLLRAIGASFDYPNWTSSNRVSLTAHQPNGNVVRVPRQSAYRPHLIRRSSSYDAASSAAQVLATENRTIVHEHICVEGVKLHLVTACCVQPGMRIHTLDGVETVKFVSVEAGEFYDLDVDGSRNFFADSVLSHNSIYGFRGATPEEFVSDARLPGAQQLTISTNYRSYAEIVDAADRMVNNNRVQIPKHTLSARGAGGRITARQGSTFDSVVTAVVDRIEHKLQTTGGQYLDPASKRPLYAVTCRTRRELDEFEDELAIRDITYVRKGGSPFWLKGDVGGVVRLLVAAFCFNGRLSLPARDQLEIITKIIQWPFRPGAPKTGDIIYAEPFAKSSNPIQELKRINKLGDVFYTRKGGARTEYDYWPTFVALRHDLEKIVAQTNLNDMLMAILQGESRGYDGDSVADLLVKSTISASDDDVPADDEEADATDAGPSRSGGVAVFDKITRFAERLGLADNPQQLIAAIRERTAAARRIEDRIAAGDQEAVPAVSLSTIHMTKGLEFENVFMVANANNFPAPVRDTDHLLVNPQRLSQYEGGLAQLKMEEERRLAYVAMTRAISNLEIYTSRSTINGKETEPSPFIAEAGIPVTDLNSAPLAESVPPSELPPISENLRDVARNIGF